MTTGWLLLTLLVVSSQNVDSLDHIPPIQPPVDPIDYIQQTLALLLTGQAEISQQLQLIMRRIGKLKADS